MNLKSEPQLLAATRSLMVVGKGRGKGVMDIQ